MQQVHTLSMENNGMILVWIKYYAKKCGAVWFLPAINRRVISVLLNLLGGAPKLKFWVKCREKKVESWLGTIVNGEWNLVSPTVGFASPGLHRWSREWVVMVISCWAKCIAKCAIYNFKHGLDYFNIGFIIIALIDHALWRLANQSCLFI